MEVFNSTIQEEVSDAISIEVVKAITMVVLCVGSILAGAIPYILATKFKWFNAGKPSSDIKTDNKVVVSLLSFGGGVLLCTTFVHLLPEVNEGVEYLQSSGVIPELPFPPASIFLCAGFFMLYLIEELVHLYLSVHEKKSGLVRTMSIRRNQQMVDDSAKTDVKNELPQVNHDVNHGHNHSHEHGHSHVIPIGGEDNFIGNLRSGLIVLALSVHELFEGLAIGLENTTGNVWYLFAAVASHKFVIAFCIGMELVRARITTCRYFCNILIFSIVSPIGIGIGLWLLSGDGNVGTQVASVVMQGLAAGTLMYVVFFEVLKQTSSGLLQFVSALVGFLVMLVIQYFTGHSHSHGGDSHGHSHNH